MKSKKILLVFLLLFPAFRATAQNITGKVVDEKGEAMAFVNVTLLNRNDSAFVKGTVSGEDGRFTLDSPCNGGIIKVTCIGYKTVYKDCEGDDMGVVTMLEDSKQLGEVVVKASLPQTVLKNGGMSTNVAGTILEKAGTMDNLLDRIPNVSAQNGDIKVFGRGTPLIYINGRQMRDRSELDRLQSDNIKSVEVITNPGASYPAGTKAVIRITTKKVQGEGFGFDASTEGEYDEKNNFGGYGKLDMNYRKNGLELGAYAFGMKQYLPDSKDLQQLTYLDNTWNQKNKIEQKSKLTTMNYRLNASYQFNDSNSIGANFGFLRNPKHTWNGDMKTNVLQDEELAEISNSHLHIFNQKTNLSSNLYYVGKIGQLGIDFNADWLWSKDNEANNSSEHYQETGHDAQSQLVNSVTSKCNRLLASKLELTHPLWGGDVTLGGEYSFTNRNSNYTIVPSSLADDDRSRIHEGMASAFLTYNRDLGKLNMEAGLRYENINFKYYEDGQYMAGQSKNYGNWFPSLSLSMPVGKVQMQLSYASDINRPSYWSLRNSVQYDNRYTYESGNPFLISEIERNLSYDAIYKWISFNMTYTHTSDPLYQNTELYKDNATIGLMTTVNGKSYDGVSASLNLQPKFGFWHPSFSAMVEKQWFRMETREGRYLDKPLAMLRFNNTFDTKLAMFTVMMTYITKGYEKNTYFNKPMFGTNLSVYKSILSDRLSFQLYVYDLFGSNNQHLIQKYGKLKEIVYNSRSISKVSLTIRYKFNTARSKYKGTGAGQEQKDRI